MQPQHIVDSFPFQVRVRFCPDGGAGGGAYFIMPVKHGAHHGQANLIA